MKTHLILAPNFDIDSTLVKNIKKLIKGSCTHSKLYITLDNITGDTRVIVVVDQLEE